MKRVLPVALLICWMGSVMSLSAGPAQGKGNNDLFPDGTGTDGKSGKPGAKQHYLLYAQVMGNVQVQLASGGVWQVKKGDVFPVIMFKEQQTIAVLQLAGATFRLSTEWLKLIEAKDVTEEQTASYRASVERFLDKAA